MDCFSTWKHSRSFVTLWQQLRHVNLTIISLFCISQWGQFHFEVKLWSTHNYGCLWQLIFLHFRRRRACKCKLFGIENIDIFLSFSAAETRQFDHHLSILYFIMGTMPFWSQIMNNSQFWVSLVANFPAFQI